MMCPHCKKNLPEGLIVCFHCGEALETPAVGDAALGVPPSTVCPHCGSNLPDGLRACIHCGRSLRESTASPSPSPVVGNAALGVPPSPKKKGGIVAAAVVVLLLGGAVGGHFMGLYTLPLLPETAGTGEATPPTNTETPGATQPGTGETPGALQSEASGTHGETQPGTTETPGAVQSEAVENPGTATDSVYGGAARVFGYTDLDLFISPPRSGYENNPGVIGELSFQFTVTGNLANVVGATSPHWGLSVTSANAANLAESIFSSNPYWDDWRYQNGRIDSGSILIETEYFGEYFGNTVNFLFFLMDANDMPIGHVVIPIQIPATAVSGNNAPASEEPFAVEEADEASENSGGDGRTNINLASQEELTMIPGIGSVLASRIVDYRDQYGYFNDIDELWNVPGIGERGFQALKDNVTID